MCTLCGDLTKPACDQDPDCGFHCYGGEHDDAHPYWESDAMCYLAELADLGATTTPSNMSRSAELELGQRAGEGAGPPDTIGQTGDLVSRSC